MTNTTTAIISNLEKEKVCYPYAYGRLDSSLDTLANSFAYECDFKGLEVNDKALAILKQMIKQLQEKALVESYAHS
jgi:hypothetical protein